MVAYIFRIHLAMSNRLWTRTLDKYTRAGMHECGEGKSGPPLEITQDSAQTKGTHPVPVKSIEIKISDHIGYLTPTAGLEGTYSIWVIIMYIFFTFHTV